MLVIRLARGGRTKYPVYRIVAAESSRAATGKFVEVLGHYNPHTKELTIKKDETALRISNGAQPSNSVIKLLQREKMELPAWVKLKTKEAKVEATAEPAGEEERAATSTTEASQENEDNVSSGNVTETAETTEAAAEASAKAKSDDTDAAAPDAK